MILRITYSTSYDLFKSLLKYLPDFIESSGILLPKLTQWLLSQNNIKNKDIVLSLNRLLHSQKKGNDEIPPKIEGVTYINNKPVSHGCIGAVYKAYFNDNQVCIKIVYPKLKFQLRQEIYLVKIIFNSLRIFSSSINNWIVTTNFLTWIDSLKEQLDLKQEAMNQTKIRNFTKHIKHFKIPEVYKHNKNYIVMEWINGKSITKEYCDTMTEKVRYDIAYTYSYSYWFITLKENCPLHGDIHIGNFLIDDKYNLVLIDFGICYDGNKFKKCIRETMSTPVLNLKPHAKLMISSANSNPLNVTYGDILNEYKKHLKFFYRLNVIIYEENIYSSEIVNEFKHLINDTDALQKDSLMFGEIISNLRLTLDVAITNFVLNQVLLQGTFTLLNPHDTSITYKVLRKLQKDGLLENTKFMKRFEKLVALSSCT